MINPLLKIIYGLILVSCCQFATALERVSMCYGDSTSVEEGSVTWLLSNTIRDIFEIVDPTIKLELAFLPWKRCQMKVKKGKIDAVMRFFSSEVRAQHYAFTDRLNYGYSFLVHLKSRFPDGFQWQTYQDLKGFRIGVFMGNITTKPVIEAVNNGWLNLDEVTTDEANLKKLIAGRVDMIIFSAPKNNPLLFNDKQQAIVGGVELSYVAQEFEKHPYVIGISKKSPLVEYMPKINEAINALRHQGKLDEFDNHW